MDQPNGLYDWLALCGAGMTALVSLFAIYLALTLRRIRRGQRAVLGDRERDLVTHAADLQRDFASLRDWLEDAALKLDARMTDAERRLDGTIAYTAMIRYDAYGEMSGRQSSSIALLDAQRNGVVLSAIHHRSHSHLYVKNVRAGNSDIDLSPEERRAIETAATSPRDPLPAEPDS